MLIFGIKSIWPGDFEIEVDTIVVVNTLNFDLAIDIFKLIQVCQSRSLTFFNKPPCFVVFLWSIINSMTINAFNIVAEM